MFNYVARVFLLTLTLWSPAGIAMAENETLDYTVTQKLADNIEQRTYPKHLVAEVTTTNMATRSDAASAGFKLLANYIFGNNTAASGQSADIAMTTPVVQSKSTKINMTTPVVQNNSANGTWIMQFSMPKNYTMATLPKPNNKAVRVFEKAGYQVAVIRFTGFATKNNIAKHEALLHQTLADKKIVPANDDAMYAFYNPPWTLPWLRRNEVWLALK